MMGDIDDLEFKYTPNYRTKRGASLAKAYKTGKGKFKEQTKSAPRWKLQLRALKQHQRRRVKVKS